MTSAARVVIKLALLVLIALPVLYFGAVFVVALIQTIKERRKAAAGVNVDAGLGFGGELGVKLIKKGQPILQ